ncbi:MULTISPECIES: hypothetical protein [unclassified Campylobacter]|uniref:hypothetical protein n=1 Tax=unclassified Campylobacter TaxID=2593542 RepID=UPI001EFAB559|nr:hypothetical protein [Campylobacter sp. RM12651]MBZ7976713.1 hypothetical protein [Campylobacter sp. RM12637]ULO02918.1 hypothetical protein AVBRAN_0448 [Campylobacter sp. RM12651]
MRIHEHTKRVIRIINLEELATDKKHYIGCFPNGYFIGAVKVLTKEASETTGVLAVIKDKNNKELICDIDCAVKNNLTELSVYDVMEETKHLYISIKQGTPTKGKLVVSYDLVSNQSSVYEFA